MRLTRRHMLAAPAAALLASPAASRVPDFRDISDPRQRAIALHDRVRDGIRFGWTSSFYAETPDETQAAGVGYCITKSAVLVRDLRANGISARMVFAEIDAGILRGLIDPGTRWLDHAFVQADLPGMTLSFDSHIVDLPLFRAAKKRLNDEQRSFGFGVHAAGSAEFGRFSQFVPGPVRGQIWGAFETVADFHATAPRVWNRLPWVARLAFGFFADAANQRIKTLRRQT